MGFFSPTFWRWTSQSYTVSSLSQGARSAVMGTTPAGFAVGNHIVVYKTASIAYTEAEYLGKITSIVGTTVNFTLPARLTRNSSYVIAIMDPATLWTAVSVPGTGGIVTTRDRGIEALDTAGKEILLTRIREPRSYVEITIKDALMTDFQAYQNWIDSSEMGGGLFPFVAAYWDDEAGRSRCDVVKFRRMEELIPKRDARVCRSWSIPLLVIRRDEVIPV